MLAAVLVMPSPASANRPETRRFVTASALENSYPICGPDYSILISSETGMDIGGGCIDIPPGSRSTSIWVSGLERERLYARYWFGTASGPLPAVEFCGRERDVPIPSGAVSLRIALMPAGAAPADCADTTVHGFAGGGFEL